MLLVASVLVLLLIVLNGVFAMSELAVVSSRRAKLQNRAVAGDKGAAAALKLADDPTRFLSAVQVGITLIGILAGAFGQATIAAELDALLETVPALQPYSEVAATTFVVVLLTYLSLIVGELVPKRLALVFPETIAGVVARPLTWMSVALSPFITLLTASSTGVLRLMGMRDAQGEKITQEEVETILAEGTSAGLIEPAEQAIIGEVMRLGDRPVRTAMTPRRDVYWVSLADPEARILQEVRACPYARFVLARDDNFDDLLGVVHKKDVADVLLDGTPLNLEALVQTPLFIPDTVSVLSALDMLKGTPVHMAFVVDELGTFEGVLSATDLLEMIAGDFPEGHDQAHSLISRREDGSYLVDGRADVVELGQVLGASFEPGAFHTAAGLVLAALGRLPGEGEKLSVSGFAFEVIDMDGPRIDKLLINAS